jgi:thiol-disulfide isomerase/thioredoxin
MKDDKTMKKMLLFATIAIFAAAALWLYAADREGSGSDKTSAEKRVGRTGAEPGEWTMDIEAARRLAGELQRPLLLNFTGSDWCGWCIQTDKRVFSQELWKSFAKNNLVLVTLDFPRRTKLPDDISERNDALVKKYNVEGFPTYLVLGSDGKSVLGRLGTNAKITPEEFIGSLQQVLRLSPDTTTRVLKNLSAESGERYAGILATIKEIDKAFETWIETEPDRTPENMKKFQDFMTRIETLHKDASAIESESGIYD